MNCFVNYLTQPESFIHKIFQKIYVRKSFFLFEGGRLTNENESKFRVSKVTYSNLTDASSFQSDYYLDKFSQFIRQGDHGFYAYIDDVCVHRSWLVSSGVVKIHWSLSYELKPLQAFIHYCETSPIARGKGIYPEVLMHIRRNYKLADSFLINVECNNIASIKGIEKAGFKKVKIARILILFGIKFNRIINLNDAN